MSNYVETKISQINDPDFQALISELYEGLNWGPDDFHERPLSFLLIEWERYEKKLTLDHVARPRMLATKVNNLIPGSVVHRVCSELARLNNNVIDAYERMTVLTLIQRCRKRLYPKIPRVRKPTKSQVNYEHQIDLIKRRRRNEQ